MRSLCSLLCLAALAAGVAACSLGLDFGPEGQPCDSRNQCLTGYACQAGYCVSSDSPSDAGTTPADGGLRPDGGTTGNALCADAESCSQSY